VIASKLDGHAANVGAVHKSNKVGDNRNRPWCEECHHHATMPVAALLGQKADVPANLGWPQ
jgi:hypothetical protein